MKKLQNINIGLLAIILVILINTITGIVYLADCRQSTGKLNCWDKALQISGLGSGGPLAMAAGIGGYTAGYNTYNPRLRQPTKQ